MKRPQDFRGWVRLARDTLFPDSADLSETHEAETQAADLWRDLFAPLEPTLDGADVLELAGDDGALAAILLDRHAPRSVESLPGARVSAENGVSPLDGMDPATVDVVVCRDLDRAFTLTEIEPGLSRLRHLLRPGGEMLVRARMADPADLRLDGAGYGVLTPTSWSILFLRAGFEIAETRVVWRDQAGQDAAAARLPDASDPERLTAEIRYRLIRPWETWEWEAFNAPRPMSVREARQARQAAREARRARKAAMGR